jgi:RsiW-degrading membrane proteinase PrsW (M82 family)
MLKRNYMMQKMATRIFIAASLVFGILGVLIVLIEPHGTGIDKVLVKCFLITIFVILSSFALSVAGKYLK